MRRGERNRETDKDKESEKGCHIVRMSDARWKARMERTVIC